MHEQRHQCELLYAQGRIHDAAESFLEIANTINDDMRGDGFIFNWLAGEFWRHGIRIEYLIVAASEFTHRCVTTLEWVGDEASNIKKDDKAVAAYSTALLLGPSSPDTVLTKWASRMLTRGSAHEALCSATKVCSPR